MTVIRNKIRLSRFVDLHNQYEAIETCLVKNISIYAYTSPLAIPWDNWIKVNNEFREIKSESRIEDYEGFSKNYGYYKIRNQVLHLIILKRYESIGNVVDSGFSRNDSDGELFYEKVIFQQPHMPILDIQKGGDEFVYLLQDDYSIRDLYIDPTDSIELEKILNKSSDNPYSSLINPIDDSMTSQNNMVIDLADDPEKETETEDYGNSKADLNTKRAHKAMIHYLIDLIEREVKYNLSNLDDNSKNRYLDSLLYDGIINKQGTVINTQIAKNLEDKKSYYFDNEKGYSFESLRKKIKEARESFK